MLATIDRVIFPDAQDININMMPYVHGDISSLPDETKAFWDIISRCNFPEGEVCYLTIDERLVKAGTSHRRPGLHTEAYEAHGCWGGPGGAWGAGSIGWGGGGWGGQKGLYMASTVDKSCAIYDTQLDGGHLGDCEPIRDMVEQHPRTDTKAGMLYWITDKTPHESLPLSEDTYRQWIRVVSPDIGGWYDEHNTRNPLGVEPNAPIIYGSKFDAVRD
jgi:hypothetical protein